MTFENRLMLSVARDVKMFLDGTILMAKNMIASGTLFILRVAIRIIQIWAARPELPAALAGVETKYIFTIPRSVKILKSGRTAKARTAVGMKETQNIAYISV